jgi:hypothetical protein
VKPPVRDPPAYSTVSVLPERPVLRHHLGRGESPTFRLESAWPRTSRRFLLNQFFLLGAFLCGAAALGLFGFEVYSGRVALGSDEFTSLLQVNEYAYVYAAAALFAFRFNRTPPNSLQVDEEGLLFTFENGRFEHVAWSEAEGETELYDGGSESDAPKQAKILLVTKPGYLALRMFAFMRPRVPRTYLTRSAFDGVLGGAERAGFTVTRYGTRYVMDRLNPMVFHPKF